MPNLSSLLSKPGIKLILMPVIFFKGDIYD